ncbi:hypothetical protein [Halpernia sp.]|uniref:FEKKY domain-containing protein n=1 Tax=Halpernia sp. TaxID=2782209 RepID=UPI003A94C4D2
MKILSLLLITFFTLNFAQNKNESKVDSSKKNHSENIENLIKSGKAKFISFGIALQDFKKFQKKYGVGVKNEGCVITSTLSKIATENNTILAKYLTKKYGNSWKSDLPFLPFGL